MRKTVVAVMVVLAVGCARDQKKNGITSSDSSSSFQGTIASSSGRGGTIDITINTRVVAGAVDRFSLVKTAYAQGTTANATGTLHFAGGIDIALSGTYSTTTKVLNLAGNSNTFVGTVSTDGVVGTFVSTSNATGAFSALSTSSSPVSRFCGTYTSSAPDVNSPGGTYVESGVWTIQVNGTLASGSATSTSTNNPAFPAGQSQSVTGQVTAGTLTLTSAEGGTATGQLTSSTSVSGTTKTKSGKGSGTFAGTTAGCQ